MSGNSTMDMLIAEMLGDVRLLHNEVIGLKDSVPQLATEFGSACSSAAEKLSDQTYQLTAEAERIALLVQALDATEKRRALEHTIASINATVASTQSLLSGVNEAIQQVGNQTSATVKSMGNARLEFESASKRLDDAVSHVENIDTAGIAAHQRTTLGLCALGIICVSLIAGWYVGEKMGSTPTPETRFVQLNDIRAMIQCREGLLEKTLDGKTNCILISNQKARIVAWRIE